VIVLIYRRLNRINRRFAHLAERIRSGRYKPRRRSAAVRPVAAGHPPPSDPLPNGFAWLVKLVPASAVFGCHLQHLLHDPEMQALIATAPIPMGKLLRPLCRMLAVTPPPILARRRPVRARLPRRAGARPGRSAARPVRPAPQAPAAAGCAGRAPPSSPAPPRRRHSPRPAAAKSGLTATGASARQ